MKLLARWLGFCAGFFFAVGWTLDASAEGTFTLAPVAGTPVYFWSGSWGGIGGSGGSAESACQSIVDTAKNVYGLTGTALCGVVSTGEATATCRIGQHGYGGSCDIGVVDAAVGRGVSGYTCGDGYTLSGSTCYPTGVCPANSTGSGGSCTCAVGFDPENGQCVARTCPDAGERFGSGSFYEMTGGGLDVCLGGCKVTARTGVRSGSGGSTKYYVEGPFTAQGGACTGSEPSMPGAVSKTDPGPTLDQQKGDCLRSGGGFVQVGGVVSCVQASPDNPVTVTDRTTTTTGGGTTTTTQERTFDGGGVVTTTTSGGEGGGTTTTSQSKAAFCEANPNAAICAGSEACKGADAITIGCSVYGTPTDDVGLGTRSVGPSSIAPVSVATAAGCPAPIVLPHGAAFEWTGMCQYAEGLRPIVLAMAWLAAGLIVFAGIKGGAG